MVRPPSIAAKAGFVRFFGLWEADLTAPDPDRLTELGKRLDDAQSASRRQAQAPAADASRGSPAASRPNWSRRWWSEAALGWGLDWLFGHFGFHTRPVFMIVFFVLGAAAGIRNVMRAANEINAEIAAAVRRRRRQGELVRGHEPDGAVRGQAARSTSRCCTSPAIRIYFTNQALLMVIVAVAAALFLTLAVKPSRAGADPRPVHGRDVLRIRRQHDPFGDRRRRAANSSPSSSRSSSSCCAATSSAWCRAASPSPARSR